MPFKTYFKELNAVAQQGDAREESFYPALAAMLKVTADAAGRKHVRVTTLPKPTDAGNPDFRLWNGTDRIVGYVEAKKPTEVRLDTVEDSEQLTVPMSPKEEEIKTDSPTNASSTPARNPRQG